VAVSCSISPQDISGGLTAKPRKPRKDSKRTTLGIASVTETITWLITLGKMCWKMMRRSVAPIAMAARTYSIRASASVLPRTSRDICAQPSADMTKMTKARKTWVGAVTGINEVSAR
jgi:CxxC motif-containing protein (DUF1111 family)